MFKATRRVEGAHHDGIWCVKWRENGVYTGSMDGTVKMWSNDLSNLATTSSQKLGVISLDSKKNSNNVIASYQDSTIRMFESPSMREVGKIDPGLLESSKISVSPIDDVVASGTHNGAVNIWSLSTFEKLENLQTNNKFILDCAFSNNGLSLASVGIDGFLNIFDVKTNNLLSKINAHGMPIRCVKFSADDNLVFTASEDRHVSVYDVSSGTIVNSFSHSGMALCLDISSNERNIVVGCADHSISYWDLGMQRPLQHFNSQHAEEIWGVSFDETGTKFVSVGDDTLLQMYESS